MSNPKAKGAPGGARGSRGFLSIVVAVMIVALAATLALTAQSNQGFVREKDMALEGSELKFAWTMGRQMADKEVARALYESAVLKPVNEDVFAKCGCPLFLIKDLSTGFPIIDPLTKVPRTPLDVIANLAACDDALSEMEEACAGSGFSASDVRSRLGFESVLSPLRDNHATCAMPDIGAEKPDDATVRVTADLSCTADSGARIHKEFVSEKKMGLKFIESCTYNNPNDVTELIDKDIHYCAVFDESGYPDIAR